MQVGDVTPNNPVEPQDIINRERTSKYEKRVIALDLSACMCLSLCTSVFAAESNMQSQIEIEIQAEKERVFSEVYRQLEIQNAVSHMSIYEEILGPEIEMSVLAKHGIGTYNANYSVPYGGVVTYTKYNCDVSITYLDYNNSYYCILDKYSFKVSSVIGWKQAECKKPETE